MTTDDELEQALTIARRAADVVSAIYATPFDVELKGPGDPVTRADRAANDVICALLAEAFPEDGILAEESAPTDPEARSAILARERVWMVDPIDGTAELVARSGEFAVMIGLVVDGRAELGVVVTPTTGEAFAARADARIAFREDARGQRTPLGVSKEQRPENVTLVLSRFHAPEVVQPFAASIGIARVVQRGSVGIKVCMVASAEVDLYVHVGSHAKLWDAAAPEAILRAAGGAFTDWSGAPIDYRRTDLRVKSGIVASNGLLHDSALEAIRRFVAPS